MECISKLKADLLDNLFLGEGNIKRIGNIPISEITFNKVKQELNISNSGNVLESDIYKKLVSLEYKLITSNYTENDVKSINKFIEQTFEGDLETKKKEFFKFFSYLKTDLFERLFTSKNVNGALFNNITNFNDYYKLISNNKSVLLSILKRDELYKDKSDAEIISFLREKNKRKEPLSAIERMALVSDYSFKLKEAHEQYIREAGKKDAVYPKSPLKVILDIILNDLPISNEVKSQFYKIPDSVIDEIIKNRIQNELKEINQNIDSNNLQDVDTDTDVDIDTNVEIIDTKEIKDVTESYKEEIEVLDDFNERGLDEINTEEIQDFLFEKSNIRLASKNVRGLLSMLPDINTKITNVQGVTIIEVSERIKRGEYVPIFFSPEYVLEALKFALESIKDKNNWKQEFLEKVFSKSFGRYNNALLSFAIRYMPEIINKNNNLDNILLFGNEDIDKKYRLVILRDNEHLQVFTPYAIQKKGQEVPEHTRIALNNIISEVISVQRYNNVSIQNGQINTAKDISALDFSFKLDKMYKPIVNEILGLIREIKRDETLRIGYAEDVWQEFNDIVKRDDWFSISEKIREKILSPLIEYLENTNKNNPYRIFFEPEKYEFTLLSKNDNVFSQDSYLFSVSSNELETPYYFEIEKNLLVGNGEISNIAKEVVSRYILYRLLSNSSDITLVHNPSTRQLGLINTKKENNLFKSRTLLGILKKLNIQNIVSEDNIISVLDEKLIELKNKLSIKEKEFFSTTDNKLKNQLQKELEQLIGYIDIIKEYKDISPYLYSLSEVIIFNVGNKETIEKRNNVSFDKLNETIEYNNPFFANPFFVEIFGSEEDYLNEKIAETYFSKYNLHISLQEDISDKLGTEVAFYLKQKGLPTKLNVLTIRHIGDNEDSEIKTFHDINNLEKIITYYELLSNGYSILHTPSNKKLNFSIKNDFLTDISLENLLEYIFTSYTIHLANKLGLDIIKDDNNTINTKAIQDNIKNKYNTITQELKNIKKENKQDIKEYLLEKYGLLENAHYVIENDNKIELPIRYTFAYDSDDSLLNSFKKEKNNIITEYKKALRSYLLKYKNHLDLLVEDYKNKPSYNKNKKVIDKTSERLNNLLKSLDSNYFDKFLETDLKAGIYELFIAGSHLADENTKMINKATELSKRIIVRQTAHTVAEPSIIPTLNHIVLKSKTYKDVYPNKSLLQSYYTLLGMDNEAKALTDKELSDGFMYVNPLISILLGYATNSDMSGITKNTIAGLTNNLVNIFDKTSTLNLHTQFIDYDITGQIRKLNEDSLSSEIIKRLNNYRKNNYEKILEKYHDRLKELEETKKRLKNKKQIQKINRNIISIKTQIYEELLSYEYSLQDYKELANEYIKNIKALENSVDLLYYLPQNSNVLSNFNEDLRNDIKEAIKTTFDLARYRASSNTIVIKDKKYNLSNKADFYEALKQNKNMWNNIKASIKKIGGDGELYYATQHNSFKLDIDLVLDVLFNVFHVITDATGSKTYTNIKYNRDRLNNLDKIKSSDYVNAIQFGEVTNIVRNANPYTISLVPIPSQSQYLSLDTKVFEKATELSKSAIEKYKKTRSLSKLKEIENDDEKQKAKETILESVLQSVSSQYASSGNSLVASKVQDNKESSLHEPIYESQVQNSFLKLMKKSAIPRVVGDRKAIGDATGIGMYIFEDVETGNTYTLRDMLSIGIVKRKKEFKLKSYVETFLEENSKLPEKLSPLQLFIGLDDNYNLMVKDDSNEYYLIDDKYKNRFIVRPLQSITIREKNKNTLALGDKLKEAIQLLKTDIKKFDESYIISPAEAIVSNDFSFHYNLGKYSSPSIHKNNLYKIFYNPLDILSAQDRKNIEGISIRIPTTSRGSFRNTRVVGFVENMNNVIFFPYETQYIEGSDNDGDTSTFIYQINNDEVSLSNKYYNELKNNLSLSENFVKSITPIDNTLILDRSQKYESYVERELSNLKEKDKNIKFPISLSTGLNKVNSQIQNQGSQKLVGYFVKFNEVYSYLKIINQERNIEFYLPNLSKEVANSFGISKFNGERDGTFFIHFDDKKLDIQPIIDKLTQTVLDDSKYNATGKQNITEFTTNLINGLLLYGVDINEILDFIAGGYDENTKNPKNDLIRRLSEFVNTSKLSNIQSGLKYDSLLDIFFNNEIKKIKAERLDKEQKDKIDLLEKQKEFLKTILSVSEKALELQQITNINRFKNNFDDYFKKMLQAVFVFSKTVNIKDLFYGDLIDNIIKNANKNVKDIKNKKVSFLKSSTDYFLLDEFGKSQILKNASLVIKDLSEIYPFFRESAFDYLQKISKQKLKVNGFLTLLNSFKNTYYDSLALGYTIDNMSIIDFKSILNYLSEKNILEKEVYVNKYSPTKVKPDNNIVSVIVPSLNNSTINIEGVYYKKKYTLKELVQEIQEFVPSDLLRFEGRYNYIQMLATLLDGVLRNVDSFKSIWSVLRTNKDTFGTLVIERKKAVSALTEDEIIFSQDAFLNIPSSLLKILDIYSVLSYGAYSYKNIRSFLPSFIQKEFQEYVKSISERDKKGVLFVSGIDENNKAIFTSISKTGENTISQVDDIVKNNMYYSSVKVNKLLTDENKTPTIFTKVNTGFGDLSVKIIRENINENVFNRPISMLIPFNSYLLKSNIIPTKTVSSIAEEEEAYTIDDVYDQDEVFQLNNDRGIVFVREPNDEVLLSRLKESFLEHASNILKNAGIEVKIVNQKEATWKGKIQNNVVYFNFANIDLDTGFHELGHYQTAILKKQFQEVYDELSALIVNTQLYKDILERYKNVYKNKEDFIDEAITELIGLYNTKKYSEIQLKTGGLFVSIISILKNIIDKLNRYINDKLFGISDIEKKKIFTILEDYATQVLSGKVQLDDSVKNVLENTIFYKLGTGNITSILGALGYTTNDINIPFLKDFVSLQREITNPYTEDVYVQLLGKTFKTDAVFNISDTLKMSWNDFKEAVRNNDEKKAKAFYQHLQKLERDNILSFYKNIKNPIETLSELNKKIKAYTEKTGTVSFEEFLLANEQIKYLKLFPDYNPNTDKIYYVNKNEKNKLSQLASDFNLLDDDTNFIVLERVIGKRKSYRLINIANKNYGWKNVYHESDGFFKKAVKIINNFAFGLENEAYTLEDTLSYQTLILAKLLLATESDAQIGELGLIRSLGNTDSSLMVRKVFPNEYNERLRMLISSNFRNKFRLNNLRLESILKESYKKDDSKRLMPDYLSFLQGYYASNLPQEALDLPNKIQSYLAGNDLHSLVYAIENRIKYLLNKYPDLQDSLSYKSIYSDSLHLEFYYLVKTYFSLVSNNQDAYNSLDDIAKINSLITTDIENKNPYFSFLYEKYNVAKRVLKARFDEYVKRVDKIFSEYKQSKNQLFYTNDESKLYERLFKYEEVIVIDSNGNKKKEKFNTFSLIKPSDAEWNTLTSAEKRFIEKYSELLSDLYLESFKHKFGVLEGTRRYKAIEHIAKYLVPPMFKVDDFALVSESNEDILQNFENILIGNQRTSKAKDYSDLPLLLYSMVNDLGSTAVRDSIIGKSNGVLDIEANRKLTTDLRSILNFFYINTERYGLLQETKDAWYISKIMSKLREIETNRSQSNIISLIDYYAQKVLFNERIKFSRDALTRSLEKSGLLAESFSTIKSLALNIGSNTKAFIVSMNKILTSTFAQRKDVFGINELRKAITILPANIEKAFFIAERFQLINSDQLRWAVSKRLGTSNKNLFNTKASTDWLFIGDKLSDMYIKLLSLTAQMIKEGTFDAYELKEINGVKELVYNPAKDKRPKELKDYILENRIREGLQGVGNLTDAYDSKQISRIELILNRIGAGLTEGSEVYLSTIPFGRALLKFKVFNMPFVNMILKPKGRNFNYKRLEIISKDGKKEVVEIMPYEESVIRTLLRSMIIVLKTGNTTLIREQFSDEQISSLRWAVWNIIYTASMFLVFMLTERDDDEYKDKNYIERRNFLFGLLKNIFQDMNMFNVLTPTGIFNLNGLVSVKGVGDTVEALWYFMTMDFDKSFRKTINSVGALNSIEEFYKAFNAEGYHDLNKRIRKRLQEREEDLKDDIRDLLDIEE